jgi:hypothetical protein
MISPKKKIGFALGILVAALLASIIVPNFLRRNIADGSDHRVGTLRTISSAAETYLSTYSNGFPRSLEQMEVTPGGAESCEHAQLIEDESFRTRMTHYRFTYLPVFAATGKSAVVSREAAANGCTAPGAIGFTVTADPIDPTSDKEYFFIDDTGVVRVEKNRPATAKSPPIE